MRLITDPQVQIGVVIVGTNEVGIAAGTGTDSMLRVVDGIPVAAEVEPGDLLMTSGLDRSPYPEGLAVGVVTELEVDEVNLEKELVVEPSGQTDRLLFVTVVLYDPEAPIEDAGDES